MCKINFKVPERNLEPPEDRRQVYADCMVCDESIREYDECLELPDGQCICSKCVKKHTKLEVTLY